MKKMIVSAMALFGFSVANGNTIGLDEITLESDVIVTYNDVVEKETVMQQGYTNCAEYALASTKLEHMAYGEINTYEQFRDAFLWYYRFCNEAGVEFVLEPCFTDPQ